MKSERIKQEDPTKQELMKTITRSRSSTDIKSSRDPPRRSSHSTDNTAIKMEDRDEAYVLIKNESKDPKEESPVKVEVEDETKLEVAEELPEPYDPDHYCKSCERNYLNGANYTAHLRPAHHLKIGRTRPAKNPDILPDKNDINNYFCSCDKVLSNKLIVDT